MSIDRYAAWLARHDIAHVVHANWIELPDLGMGVVVTLTPPLSRNATLGACRRVTDRSLGVLIESAGCPLGEWFSSGDNGNQPLGLMAWVHDGGRMVLRRVPKDRPC